MDVGYWIPDSIKDQSFEDFYKPLKEIGRGSTSVVYECQHSDTNEKWAVKVITKKVDKKIIRSEIGALLRLDHPNVVRLKEIYENVNHIFLVLELVHGGELFDRLVDSGKFTEKHAAGCVRQILEAVDYLHRNDVVHRDLKPENLLYATEAVDSPLKVADFGLSKVLGDDILMQTVCGTPGYCAPEILRGTQYDSAVDVWSCGVILYILLCGYEPFYADNETDMYRNILQGKFEFHSAYWNGISENAKQLIRKMLTVDPKKRISAGEALVSPWVSGQAATDCPIEMDKLKQFNSQRKLRSTVSAMIAAKKILRAAKSISSDEPGPLCLAATDPVHFQQSNNDNNNDEMVTS